MKMIAFLESNHIPGLESLVGCQVVSQVGEIQLNSGCARDDIGNAWQYEIQAVASRLSCHQAVSMSEYGRTISAFAQDINAGVDRAVAAWVAIGSSRVCVLQTHNASGREVQ